jgi:CYTH domain-containing protein
MPNMDEIEVTFLPRYVPSAVASAPATYIEDMYVPQYAEHPRLRVRRSGEMYELTKKVPVDDNDASHQREFTVPLSQDEYSALSAVSSARIAKWRYQYGEGAMKYEVDVFEGGLAGLVLVDVEFSSREAYEQFSFPKWFLANVTQESFIAGGKLCSVQYEDIAGTLNAFGYTPLVV